MNTHRAAAEKASEPNSVAPDRLAESVDQEQVPRLPFMVVGIGASAGGLEAFLDFFRAMPPDSGMAFVLVQHLPPERESLVADIIAKHTQMPVRQVEDGMTVETNHVYVIRPGRTMTISRGALYLGEPLEKRGHQRPVDDFFRSLAAEQRERSIAIIMSGMGSNGTAGAQTIKAVGGICIAQDPETAKFPSMPRNLIEAGNADFIFRVEEIPGFLLRYNGHPYSRGEVVLKDGAGRDRLILNEITGVLRARTRLDFSGYKKPTVIRRVQRRMGIHQIVAPSDYVRLLRQSPPEVTALADDLMIHVTGFFRDSEAWDALREKVLVPLIADRPADSTIRAWVTACSTGEEAYTLAILLLEVAEAAGKNFDFKIFATDTAERSLGTARTGVYAGGIESEVSPERLERFFDRSEANYRIKKILREMVVFAPQNILQDPPFSRLDLCTCRNLLIYLESEVQQRALAMMHFGLVEGGALLLGSSETIAGAEELYQILDKKNRIFRRVGPLHRGSIDLPLAPAFFVPLDAESGKSLALSPRATFMHMTHRILLDRFSPAAVVVDRQHRIVYFHGATDRYLEQPRGEPTRELTALTREFVRGAVRTALQRAGNEEGPIHVRGGLRETPEGSWRLEISVHPLELRKPTAHLLVTFEERKEEVIPVSSETGLSTRQGLEQELDRMKEELRRAVEELQSSNEELKASNEEATSINEELQSINEELETSKEELQTLNEELTTVNTQLQEKMNELESTTNDLTSLLSSTNIAVLFLDPDFHIRRFTPAVKDLLGLIPADIGRPLSDLALKFHDADLQSDAREVLEKLVPREAEITSESGRIYLRRALPYRTTDNRIAGVVIAFFDIGDRKQAEAQLQRNEARSQLVLDHLQEYAIFILDASGRISTWMTGAERIFGFTASEAVGQSLALIATSEDRAGGVAEKELQIASAEGRVSEDHWHQRKDGSRFWGSGMLYAVKENGRLSGYVKVLRDNTDHKRTEETLLQAKLTAEDANAAKDQFLANVSHELRTPLSAMLLWTKLLRDQGDIPAFMEEGLQAIEKCANEQQTLIEDIVDTSRIVAGKMRLELRSLDLTRMVRTAIEAIRPAANQKEITVTAQYDPQIGLVSADSNRLHQVVWNLLTNSVKFTPARGNVTLLLRRVSNEIEMQVTDSGVGISPELLPRIFERFRQAEYATTRSHSGLGLGLSIARQLVELHGGTLTASSAGAGQGATFTVRLPLPFLDPTTLSVTGSASPVGSLDLTGLQILLVEDAEEGRKAIATLLRGAGAIVTVAEKASSALDQMARHRPDVLISDIGLPEMDGHELIRRVREIEKVNQLPELPALALTAYADDVNHQKALRSGFLDCLTKPIDTTKLLWTLAKFKKSMTKR